jgi:hypothetical protein
MAIQANCIAFQRPLVLEAATLNNLKQNQPGDAPPILQMPMEVLVNISEFAVASDLDSEAGKKAVLIGRVCALMNVVTYQESINEIIRLGVKATLRWVDHPTDPTLVNVVNYLGRVTMSQKK